MNKYIEIYENIKQDIEAGVFKYGDKLPSKRILSDKYNVSIITIEHTLDLLLEEGYILSKERSGYFVIYDIGEPKFGKFNPNKKHSFYVEPDVHARIHKYTSSLKHIHNNNKTKADIDSSAASAIAAQLFPFSNYFKSIRRVLSDYDKEILVQTDNQGSLILRQSISDYLKRNRNISCDPDQIIIGSGAEYLYGIIVEMLGNNLTYALENPSYGKIAQVYKSKGASTLLLTLDNDGIKSSDLTKDFDVLHITPYRSYPSNITASASKKREYINWQSNTNGVIIEDDFTSEFSPSLKPVDTIYSKTAGNVIYINTFSQTISPATRIAYMVLPESILQTYKNRTGFYSCTVSTLDQLVLADFINNGYFERHLNRVRRALRSSK